jgi:hypothetical protein
LDDPYEILFPHDLTASYWLTEQHIGYQNIQDLTYYDDLFTPNYDYESLERLNIFHVIRSFLVKFVTCDAR